MNYASVNNRKYYDSSFNTFIRSIVSPEYSKLVITMYETNKTNLIFKLIPWIGRDKRMVGQYCKKTFISTSIAIEGVVYFYQIAMSIVNGDNAGKPIKADLQCGNKATLTFEYKPNKDNQMEAYLIMSKNNITIPYKLVTKRCQVIEKGQLVTKVTWSDLDILVNIMEEYLKKVGVDYSVIEPVEDESDNEQKSVPNDY